jgi:hypothetical protein
MRKTLAISAVVSAALGCGDNRAGFEGEIHHDGGNPDAAQFPAPPALGAQLDRMGRPAIVTTLIGTFASDSTKATLRDAYNQAGDAAAWIGTTLRPGVTIEAELKTNLATWDAFDTGLSLTGAGCGNALHYMADPGPDSYKFAADVLADDELYVDTSKSVCTVYFALELEKLSGGNLPHGTCGGRMPTRNVMDAMFSMLAAGTAGLDGPGNDFAPKIHGSLTAHSDVKDITFPFLGAPH